VRRSIAALHLSKHGDLVAPTSKMEACWRILDAASEATGVSVDELLNGWDPDPRICARSYRSLEDALLDLDERERYRAVRIAHSLRCSAKELLAREPDMIQEIWSIAHDQSIVECNAARAAADKNGGVG